jgi:hypothetical protein
MLGLLVGGAEAQTFTTAAIGQSNPLVGASNTITVTIATDTTLTPGATALNPTVITLTGASLKPCYAPPPAFTHHMTLMSNAPLPTFPILSAGASPLLSQHDGFRFVASV